MAECWCIRKPNAPGTYVEPASVQSKKTEVKEAQPQ